MNTLRVSEYYKKGKPVISLEVFPPKKNGDSGAICRALSEMAAFRPDFISVTCGAGGSGSVNRTLEIAEAVEREHGVSAIAHMTCVAADRRRVREQLEQMRRGGVRNVLALRGDIPADGSVPAGGDYRYAADLIRELRGEGWLCIGAACYPEGHIDCEDIGADIRHLHQKQEAGADFLISQLFFENSVFYHFRERAAAGGVRLPISAGIMPILSRRQIERMIFMCGASLPSSIIKLLHKYENSPSDLCKAGIEHAAEQARDLLDHGVDGVHFYTMNKPDIAEAGMRRIGRIS